MTLLEAIFTYDVCQEVPGVCASCPLNAKTHMIVSDREGGNLTFCEVIDVLILGLEEVPHVDRG